MDTNAPYASFRMRNQSFPPFWVIALIASVTSVAAPAQTYEVVHAFRNSGQPRSSLIQATDGYFYGTTYFGGTCGVGTIFRIDSEGNLTTLHSFCYANGAHPVANLIQSSAGDFYGTTSRGGASNLGAIFRMDSSGNLIVVHSFHGSDGAIPEAPLLQVAGDFYGTTFEGGAGLGTVFKMDSSGALETLHAFSGPDGATPHAALIRASDGDLYGTTAGGGDATGHGTIFRMDSSWTLTTLHVFNPVTDGANPYAPLLQAHDGYLYGTTTTGGAPFRNGGSVYRIDSQGDFTNLHVFDSQDGHVSYAPLIEATHGYFYGTTGIGGEVSSVFRIDSFGNVVTVHRFDYDAKPYAGLLATADWSFLGTAAAGGADSPGIGAIFRIDPLDNFETLYTFSSTEPVAPQVRPVEGVDGTLYGVAGGGPSGLGLIYGIDSFGELSLLHSFSGPDGATPVAALCRAADGNLYGTTGGGGSNGLGTVFELLPNGNHRTLHSFAGNDGAYPSSEMIQGSDGNFYGTTSGGGYYEYGTAFRMNEAGDVTVLHDFRYPEGENPAAGLIQAADGDYYGTTPYTIFKVSSAGDFTKLFDFYEEYGAGSKSSLLQLTDGNFYGVSASGGAAHKGVVYTMDASAKVTTLHSFSGWGGTYPHGALLQAADGYLYGTTLAGGATSPGCPWADGCGTIYRVDPSGDFHLVHSFNILDGRWPLAGLNEASDGRLYGTASGGGPFGGQGVIFRLSNSQIAVNEVSPSSGAGVGDTPLVLLGGGLVPSATVTVGGLDATNVTVADPTFLYLTIPALSPGTLNDVSVTIPQGLGTATATHPNAYFADFLDVTQIDPFHDDVEKIVRNGVTAGCGEGNYCPQDAVTRAQMAVFLLKSKHGSAYVPPPCTGVFGDVPCPSMFADWIEQLAVEGITAGCGGGNYCPTNPVMRAQMAAFLLKAEHGPAYQPPSCTGLFPDVPCPSLFADWVEQLAAEGITAGCGGGNYCPDASNTRAQMAAFLVKTFGM